MAPSEWIEDSLRKASIDFSGDDVRFTKGLELDIVENDQFTDSGWLKLEFDDIKVGITGATLAKTGEDLSLIHI